MLIKKGSLIAPLICGDGFGCPNAPLGDTFERHELGMFLVQVAGTAEIAELLNSAGRDIGALSTVESAGKAANGCSITIDGEADDVNAVVSHIDNLLDRSGAAPRCISYYI